MMMFGAFIVARDLDMDAGTFADEQGWFECTCVMVFPLEMEQTIMTSLCDVMRISHARQGRKVYKESMTGPWGCCNCCLGVLVQSICIR